MDAAASTMAADELQLEVLRRSISAQQNLLAQLRVATKKDSAIEQLRHLVTNISFALDSLQATFRLLDLPRELRNEIYKLCIGHGKIFLPNSFKKDVRYHDRKDYDEPQWQLLAINKQIRTEAVEILFVENQIIFSDMKNEQLLKRPHWGLLLRPDWADPTPPLSLRDFSSVLLTSVSLAFDMRSRSKNSLIECLERVTDASAFKKDAANQQQQFSNRDCVHTYDKDEIFSEWIAIVKSIAFFPNLRRLGLDVTHSYCTLGCCSLSRVAEQAISKFVAVNLRYLSALESVDVAGLKTKVEQKLVIDHLKEERTSFELIDADDEKFKKYLSLKKGRRLTISLEGFNSRTHRQHGGYDFRDEVGDEFDWDVPARTFALISRHSL